MSGATADAVPPGAGVPGRPEPVAAGQPAPSPQSPAQQGQSQPPPPPQAPLVNAANGLTVLRLVLVPAFAVVLVLSDGESVPLRIAAALLFTLASLTDLYDGRIARARNLVTPFGEVADPIADKALTGAALIGLSWLGLLWWWVTALILVREIGVTLLRFWVIRHGVIPASRGGKLKTLLQVVAIIWYLCPWPEPLAMVGAFVMAAAVIATVVTGVDYVVRAVTLRRRGRARTDVVS